MAQKAGHYQQTLSFNHEPPEAVNACAHHLIETRTREQPDSPAICSWDGEMTYAELDVLSSRLAHFLQTQGVGPEVFVPICSEKSLWTIVSLVAVLKSGGAFILLDPSQPVGRLNSIVRQTCATFALSSTEQHSNCKTFAERVFVINAQSMAELEHSSTCSTVSPQNAAYVIFTSGSTGIPKGVLIEHSQLSTSSIRGGDAMGFRTKPRVFQFASYTFDACILEIITTLIFGGTVCVPSESERSDGIVEAMRRMDVTCAFVTPSLLNNLDLAKVGTLETLIVGGEPIPLALIQLWAPRLRLVLAYGPTECCVICFVTDAGQNTVDGEIGQPISARAWAVKPDDYNTLADPDELAELLIEGPVLARGYLNDIAKTDAQFISNPAWMALGKGGHSRLYRTGDLIEYRCDGTICYKGRIDGQIKIRGQRLELGEVEKQLQRCLPQVEGLETDQVIVDGLVPAGSHSSRMLVAFLSVKGLEPSGCLRWSEDDIPLPASPEADRRRFSAFVSELVASVRLALPAYAIPSFYVPLNDFPLAISGKADRKRLRNIAAQLSSKQLAAFTDAEVGQWSVRGPITPTERQLQGLWADMFDIKPDEVYPNDSFFSLGGDSVQAIRLVAAARGCGLNLSVQTINKHPVFSDMALAATQLQEQRETAISPFELLGGPQSTSQILREASEQCSVSELLIEDIYPCSPMQSGLLASSMKNPGAYVMQLVYTLPASLDVDNFMRAWDEITSQNAILRTRFFQADSSLLQVVIRESPSWKVVKDVSLDSLLAAERDRKMFIGERMSWHTLLCPAEAQDYRLIWNVHHSLLDGWSAAKITYLVEQAYLGRLDVPSPTVPFNRFIQHVLDQDTRWAKFFWKNQLVDAPAPVFPTLPSLEYTPRAKTVRQCRVPSLKRADVTISTMVQTAWCLLLGIYSSSSDIVTGMTLSGRTAQLPGIDCIIGPTITTVPLRIRFDRNESVIDLLRRVQNQNAEIMTFDQLGLSNIKHLSPDADAACNFRTLLVIQPTEDGPPRLISGREYTFSSVDCALMMECELYNGSINLRATFDDRVMHPALISRIFQQLEHILSGIYSSGPLTKVSDIQQISSADTQQILKWNSACGSQGPSRTLVHALFEQRQQGQPDDLAICAWDGELSYRELDEYSSRLAAHLQAKHKVGPESLVTICFEKSRWVVVAMLAVLKAGGACVPTDPNHPTERLQTILQCLGRDNSKLILTSAAHKDRLGATGCRILVVDASQLASLPPAHDLETASATPSNPAFVVFTSGSTGNPKGIVLEHSALCSSILAHGSFIQLGPHSRVLQFAAHTFDISIGDIFGTLIHGGCVCIPSEHDRMNNLASAMRNLGVNHVSLTATVASFLQPEDVPSLKVLVVAGEPMTRSVLEQWAASVTLINMYGPAECTIYCIGKFGIRREDDYTNIGRGVGATAWIVDDQDPNCLTPIGGVGEILIEGPNLARGYLGDETQTQAAFIEDPAWAKRLSGSSVRRFYRTGDLGFYNLDGSISFVGRNDGQIKIRGQRVEIVEVEYRLRECLPDTIESVVSVVAPKSGGRLLAAFIAVKSGCQEMVDAIAQTSDAHKRLQEVMDGVEKKLQSLLPSYMVPSLYLPISKVPLSASGKIDRRRLQSLVSEMTTDELSSLRGPRTSTVRLPSSRMEKRIQRLWGAVLNVGPIGLDDHFFRLGGDSLTAMRLVSAARKEGIALTVDQVFKNPILSDMALASVDKTLIESVDVPPFSLIRPLGVEQLCSEAMLQCNIRREQIEDIYPCTPLQGIWIGVSSQTFAPADSTTEQGQVVFSLPRDLDLKRFRAALCSLVSRHEILRSRIIRTAHGIFQVVVDEPAELRTAACLNEYLRKDREEVIECGQQLQRYCFIEVEDTDERYFVWSASHASYDGWGLKVFFEELEATYLRGPPHDPSVKMNAFIKHIGELDKAAASDFFRSHLAAAVTKPLVSVPDGYGPYHCTLAKRTIRLPSHQGSEITRPILYQAAWSIVIGRMLGVPDVVFDTVRAGRNVPVPGVEHLVGPTATTMYVRVRLGTDQTVRGWLESLGQAQVAAMPFEHLGQQALLEMAPEVEPLVRDAVRLNIIPFVDTEQLGRGVGLTVERSFVTFEVPFYIVCETSNDHLNLGVMADKGIISEARVDGLMRRFEHVLLQLLDAQHSDPEKRIADIDFSEVSDPDWSCTRSPWDWMAKSESSSW